MAKNKEKTKEEFTGDVATAVGGVHPKELDIALEKRNAIEAKMSELRGDMSAVMTRFEEQGGNKKAFKLAQQISNMEESKARDFWLSLEAYMEYFGVFKQLNLFEEPVTIVKPAEKGAAPKAIGVAQAEAFASAHH